MIDPFGERRGHFQYRMLEARLTALAAALEAREAAAKISEEEEKGNLKNNEVAITERKEEYRK